ncbi:ComF family protein [Streptomyces sp. TR06-5]|uniref:ComF family protein n=1 Tax=unclassified Streptomyces TaxID=2593676 RepID=UPI0039A3BDC7
MRALWQELTDLVMPGCCAGCGAAAARRRVCGPCRDFLARAVARRVRPAAAPAGLPSVHACLGYADEVRALLLAHKERGALPLAQPLGVVLARAVRAAAALPVRSGPAVPWVLVPVPSARRAVAARGHDPVRRMALGAAAALRRSGTPARVLPALRRARPVADQAGLSAPERAANLHGALEAVPACGASLAPESAAPPPVVLVDDLITTGASLAEAARALRECGGAEPSAAVVAARCRNGAGARPVLPRTGGVHPMGGTCQ